MHPVHINLYVYIAPMSSEEEGRNEGSPMVIALVKHFQILSSYSIYM